MSKTPPTNAEGPRSRRPAKVLVTAGPTEEPLDEVRFLGNRSSGRMGIAIAEAFLELGTEVHLLLGPVRIAAPADQDRLETTRFRTASELQAALERWLPEADLVVMAAAVADYRPTGVLPGKTRRTEEGLTLELEAVPDLLASTRGSRKDGSMVVGFALEPRSELEQSAVRKLERKDLAAIVANPLETMDAETVEGALLWRDGRRERPDGAPRKQVFARWLAERLLAALPPAD